MKKRIIYLSISSVFIIGVLLYSISGGFATQTSVSILSVENLSCGSCIEKISAAFSDVKAVASVEVDLGLAQALITFDEKAISSEELAAIITGAGYPSTHRQTLSSEEYNKLITENVSMSKTHVGKVGSRLITNEEFTLLVDREFGSMNKTDLAQYTSARKSVWDRVVQKEVILQIAAKSTIVIQPGEVDAEVETLAGKIPNFKDLVVERYGSFSIFKLELREKLLIDRYLGENVFVNMSDDLARQQAFGKWYSDLSKNTNITIFDKTLKASASGGCGGSCCG